MNTYKFIWHPEYKMWQMKFDNGANIWGISQAECYNYYVQHN